MILIAGLGNPGQKYKNTRHNLGFRAIDGLSSDFEIELSLDEKKEICAGKGSISGKKIILAKPQSFMNNSGHPIAELVKYYKIAHEDSLIVVCDDLDTALGRIRIRKSGTSAGHNGIESIISALGSNVFVRVRIGIGRPEIKEKVTDYVLSVFEKDEIDIANESIVRAKEAVVSIIKNGIEDSMNIYNRRQ